MSNKFTKSELGTKAAWKGFSSQTSYIAYRLMLLKDESVFYPEQAEDLMIRKDDMPQELVQVKNLSADLALSHLSPQKSDSFFRRCLSYKSENENLVLTVASFGNIGSELSGFINKNEDSRISLHNKMLEYGYLENEIDWLFQNIRFEQIEESKILNDVYAVLETKIEAMAAPKVAFDILINYISSLSRTNSYTSKAIWDQKISTLALDLASISGLIKQYGQTLFPIYDYTKDTDYKTMKEEYQLGIDAHPQYIRENLDIIRPYWLRLISYGFDEKNIVLIRGASGQGKSTLAYRFLLDNYPEADIICVSKILSEENAVEICAALKGLSKNRTEEIIVYIDVAPYDTRWIWLCQEIQKHESNTKLLVTIREDDFRRTPIDYNKVSFREIELSLAADEARDIYTHHGTSSFLSFEEAWKSFGGQGPLMEFAYLLNQSDTLENRLSAQINNIVLNEPNADEWITALSVICYAGKNNISINQSKLFASIQCSQRMKMLKVFEKEYFIRQTSDGNIECLHALRALVLNRILFEKSALSEQHILLTTLCSIQKNALIMVVEYIYNNGFNRELIDNLSNVAYDSWQLYSSVLQALLWGSVWTFFQNNKEIIANGDALYNGAFAMLGLGDITGYYKKTDMSVFYDIVKKDNEDRYNKMLEMQTRLKDLQVEYNLVDRFLSCTSINLPSYIDMDVDELSPCGFALFWMALRNFFLAPPEKVTSSQITLSNMEDHLNFVVGIQMQNWDGLYSTYRDHIEALIIPKFNLAYLDSDGEEVSSVAICNVFSKDAEFPSNDTIMEIVNSLRKLYLNKTKYNVEYTGHLIIDGITIPDIEKHIPADNLPLTWITQMNRWLSQIIEYEKRPEYWPEVVEGILETRKTIVSACNRIIRGIDSVYRDRNTKVLFSPQSSQAIANAYVRTSNLKFQMPKCAIDRYGIRTDNSIVDTHTSEFALGDKTRAESSFGAVFNKYCSSLSNFFSYFISPNNLLIEKLKKVRPSEQSRLSRINLISALDEIDKMQSEYSALVERQVGGKIEETEEKASLMLLSNMWDYIYTQPFFKQRSLSVQRKQADAKYAKKLARLFEVELPQIEGVYNYSKLGKSIFITIESDAPCKELFEEFKRQFPDAQPLSYKGNLFKDYLDEISITYRVLGQELPAKFIVKSNQFIIYDDVEKFMKLLHPEQDEEVKFDSSLLTSAIMCFGNIQVFPTIIKHCSQVSDKYKSLDATYVQPHIYETWVNSVSNNAIIPTIEAINNALDFSVPFIPEEQHSEAVNIYDSLKQTTSSILDNPREMIEISQEEAEEFASTLEGAATTYYNFFPL